MDDLQTRLIVISSDSNVTPEIIKEHIMFNYEVTVKDTCYGALIEGEEGELKEVIKDVRKLDKNGIFSKNRGFPIGDPRICRKERKGGPRPGFHQLDAEFKVLPLIRSALDALDEGKDFPIEKDRKIKMDPKDLLKMVENI
ncbi:MAG: methanogenesis marker 6 protein [Halobacteriota archaeon]|nr:methanogenesis marker 6 protein [Halobacteriota archaeon]